MKSFLVLSLVFVSTAAFSKSSEFTVFVHNANDGESVRTPIEVKSVQFPEEATVSQSWYSGKSLIIEPTNAPLKSEFPPIILKFRGENQRQIFMEILAISERYDLGIKISIFEIRPSQIPLSSNLVVDPQNFILVSGDSRIWNLDLDKVTSVANFMREATKGKNFEGAIPLPFITYLQTTGGVRCPLRLSSKPR